MGTPYKKPYLLLFNRITDALSALNIGRSDQAQQILIQAQRDAEELYISSADGEVFVLPNAKNK